MNTDSGTALERALRARRGGNALLCYDLASQALAEHPDDARLAYPAVLALADLGNLDLATELYERYSVKLRAPDEDWLALRGRLRKELALREDGDAAEHFRHSALAYEAAFSATRRPFSGINAASMFLLAGDPARAGALAAEVLKNLEGERLATEGDRYFNHATRAEASLLLGRIDEARAALQAADAFLQRDAAARGRTLRQLRLIAQALNADPALLSALAMPEYVYVLPAREADPAAQSIERLSVAARIATLFVVPGLSVEIETAEQALAQGAALHLVLPAEQREALAAFGARWGGGWAQRLERLMSQAQDVSSVTGFVTGEEDRALEYARQVARGLARLRARHTGAALRVLRCTRAGAALVGGFAADDDPAPVRPPQWRCPPGEARPFEVQRRQAALIFADATGFSQLHDRDLPDFWNRLMPEVARSLARHSGHVLLQSTWGDALYIVLDEAQAAAAAGVDILATVARLRGQLSGALSKINLRLSIHYAPVYTGWDPVGLGKLYYGSHVSLAARIEPVTPPGSIYVTEALAAQLALEGAQGFDLIYAGEVELAKRYGKRRMFHLRASGAGVAAPEAPAPRSGELLLGCTGSLLLTREQARWVRDALREQVLPELRRRFEPARVALAMGLAPGADLLFALSAREWLVGQGLPYRMQTVLPAPPEAILADWNERASVAGSPVGEADMRAHWADMSRLLDESAVVVNLWPAQADAVDLATRSFRQRQYRRLGAYLAQHSDVLIAICDPDKAGGAGGAAEVVAWRCEPGGIPPELSTDSSATAQRRSLVVMNPQTREVKLDL